MLFRTHRRRIACEQNSRVRRTRICFTLSRLTASDIFMKTMMLTDRSTARRGPRLSLLLLGSLGLTLATGCADRVLYFGEESGSGSG